MQLPIPLPLAHGAFGSWDEIFLVLAAGVFVLMLLAPIVLTWLREHRHSASEAAAQSEPSPEQTDSSEQKETQTAQTANHFRLN